MFRSAVYKAIIFTTALLCLLSFSDVGHLSAEIAKEVTHYMGDDHAVCSRTTLDDHSDLPQREVVFIVPRSRLVVAVQEIFPAYEKATTHHEIRGPPAIASLI